MAKPIAAIATPLALVKRNGTLIERKWNPNQGFHYVETKFDDRKTAGQYARGVGLKITRKAKVFYAQA